MFPLRVLFPNDSNAAPPLFTVAPRPASVKFWVYVWPVPPSRMTIAPLNPDAFTPLTDTVLFAAPSAPGDFTTSTPLSTVMSPTCVPTLEAPLTPRRTTPPPVSSRLPVPEIGVSRFSVEPEATFSGVSPVTATVTLVPTVTVPAPASTLTPEVPNVSVLGVSAPDAPPKRLVLVAVPVVTASPKTDVFPLR